MKKQTQVKRHHIDRRAHQVVIDDASADDLLSTIEVAEWLGCSHQWLEIGRSMGYGPPATKISSRMVRYRRGDVNAWLAERAKASMKEYSKRREIA